MVVKRIGRLSWIYLVFSLSWGFSFNPDTINKSGVLLEGNAELNERKATLLLDITPKKSLSLELEYTNPDDIVTPYVFLKTALIKTKSIKKGSIETHYFNIPPHSFILGNNPLLIEFPDKYPEVMTVRLKEYAYTVPTFLGLVFNKLSNLITQVNVLADLAIIIMLLIPLTNVKYA